MDLADFKQGEYGGRDPDKSDGSGSEDMSSQVVINSLSELARVFNFNVVEFRSSSSTNYSLTYLYVDNGRISMQELQAMTSNRERNSLDLCKKAAKMTAKVCWRRKTKKPDDGKTIAALEFHTAAAYHLIKKSETEDDVFLVGYALDTVEFDLTKAYLLAHFARSARDAALKNAATNAKYANKNGSRREAKDMAEPRTIRSNGEGSSGFKTSEKSAAWEEEGDWEDDNTFTARTDVSDISTASGSYRWALFTPAVPGTIGESPKKDAVESYNNVPQLVFPTPREKVAAGSIASLNSNLLSVRDFHCRLSSRGLRDDFETGIDIEAMMNMEKITDGTNGQVFGAIYRNKRVVIKAVFSDKINNKIVMDEFCFEAEILARLSHPNICKAVGSGYKPLPFIVMEELQQLPKYVNMRGPEHARLSFEQVLQLAKDLSDALLYLHEQLFEDAMVIHRDLKPENIGVDSAGRLKLFDFGLGRCVKKRSKDTESYKMTGETGTLRYMAPEVVLSKPYTEKVDTYSFGIVVWTMATNTVAFAALTAGGSAALKKFHELVVVGGERPPLDPLWPTPFRQLLSHTWDEVSERRPPFSEVSVILRDLISEIREQVGSANSNALMSHK